MRYETRLAFAPTFARLKKNCALTEEDISDEYNGVFPRRHRTTRISAVLPDRKSYLELLDYAYEMYGHPAEFKQAEVYAPIFPYPFKAIVYQGYKHAHARIYPPEIADSFTIPESDMDTAPALPGKQPLPDMIAPRRRKSATVYNYEGMECSLAEIAEMANISYKTLFARMKRGMDLNTALTTPVKKQGARSWSKTHPNMNPPTLPA